MRNLQQNPITKEEVIGCLKDFSKEVDPAITRRAGDMRFLLLLKAIKILEETGEEKFK